MKEGGSHARQVALAFGALFLTAGVAMVAGGWWPRWTEYRDHHELATRGGVSHLLGRRKSVDTKPIPVARNGRAHGVWPRRRAEKRHFLRYYQRLSVGK